MGPCTGRPAPRRRAGAARGPRQGPGPGPWPGRRRAGPGTRRGWPRPPAASRPAGRSASRRRGPVAQFGEAMAGGGRVRRRPAARLGQAPARARPARRRTLPSSARTDAGRTLAASSARTARARARDRRHSSSDAVTEAVSSAFSRPAARLPHRGGGPVEQGRDRCQHVVGERQRVAPGHALGVADGPPGAGQLARSPGADLVGRRFDLGHRAFQGLEAGDGHRPDGGDLADHGRDHVVVGRHPGDHRLDGELVGGCGALGQ